MRSHPKFCFLVLLALIYSLLGTSVQAQTDNSFCWKSSFGRGVGTLPSACPNGYSKELAACYTTCKSGFEAYSKGAVVCEQQCPAGFTDMPGTCTKPAATSSAGYPWQFGDGFNLNGAMARCTSANPSVGCYISGAIVYPNCAAGYHKFGDLVCTPNCPSNMTDSGAFCSKLGSYTRQLTTPGCPTGTTNESGLCYSSCGAGFTGNGPVCWSSCPSDHPFACGAACATSQSACANAVGTMAFDAVAVVLDIGSIFLGGEGAGITDAGRAAMEAGETAKAASVAAETAEIGESTLMNAVKTYSVGFGKQFAKSLVKNAGDNTNLYWRAGKAVNSSLSAINKAATEYGAEKDGDSFDLNTLTAVDPTGISSLVTSFTKYGSCTSGQFSVDQPEMSFPAAMNGQSQLLTIRAQRPTTITRIVSPALNSSTIIPSADCIGKKLNPNDVCHVQVAVKSALNLDSEIRIYSDEYNVFPLAVHILANPQVAQVETAVPNVDEAANLTDIQGVWAYANNQSKKMIVSSTGRVTATGESQLGTSGYAVVSGDAGRAFTVTTEVYNQQLTVNDAGDRLTSAPLPGYIGISGTPFVLSLSMYSTANSTPIIEWTNNHVSAQNFTFDSLGDGTFRIVSGLSGRVLTVQNNTTDDGAPIVEFDWRKTSGQIFRIESLGDGSYYRIVNVGSGLALTVSGDINVKGGALVQSLWSDLPSQHFTVATDYKNFIRRPWDPGCNAGETKYASLCYDVPPGYAMTSPGIMGKVCPTDWRDDGTSCWPAWTGSAIPAQADPNGGDTMRHPITVTSASFSSGSCPANFSKLAITCTAIITSKNITGIMGHVPN